MSPDECARILAIAGTYDSRLTPPSRADAQARSVAWSKALHETMPVDWAADAVVDHYANQTSQLMPAHLNQAWKSSRRAAAERRAAETALAASDGVPMPEHIKAEITRILERVNMA